MSGSAEAWPGQEVVAQPQWPGQEVTPATGRGELGYAAAPPLPPAPVTPSIPWNPVGDELGNIYTPAPPPSLDDIRSALPGTDSLSVGGIRKAMAPEPGYVPTGILPFSLKETTPGSGVADPNSGLAGMHWDWGPVRSVVNPLLDLLEGTGLATSVGGENAPLAGKVSPEATAFLLGSKLGNPVSQIRDPLAAAEGGGDLRLGAPQVQPPSTGVLGVGGDLRAAPLPDDFKAAPMTPGGSEAAEAARTGVPVTRDAPLMTYFNRDETPPPTTPPPSTPTGIPAVAPPEPSPIQPASSAPPTQPGPQSGGAAASRDGTDPAVLAAKTPAQALNDFRTSVTQTARDRASPGVTPGTVEDHNVYVPGVTRLESARVFDPEVAGNHDALRDIDPAYKTAADKIEQDNHDILKDTYLQQAGDTNSVAALEDQRNAVSPNALGVFQNERPVSAQPVADAIQAIKDSPAWKIDAVRNVMQKVEKGLYDANGNLETLPSQLYGARQNLTTIRDSNALTQEASDAKTARYQLGQVLAPLDQVIGEGSNGYKDVYLPQWANYSRLIDQQRYLQSKTLGAGKVTGPDGNLTANGMQKLLDQIAVDKGKRGNNPAKTLTEPQLDNLVAIRNELAAMQYRDQLAKSSGSPTVKKAAAAARLGNPVLNAARETAIHGVLAHTTGGAGNVVYQLGVKPIMERGRERKAATVMATMRNRLLNTTIPTE